MSAPEDIPAFPSAPAEDCPVWYEGMALRDWFAGQALTGALAGGEYAISGGTEAHIACLAYNFADAMLQARAKAQAIVVGGVG